MKIPGLIALSAVVLSVTASASTVYVTKDGTGDGSSWANAKGFATAVAEAQAGDELRLKAETYPLATDGVTAGYTIAAGITLKGGYTGNDADPDARAADAYTVFDGEMTAPTGDAILICTATTGTLTLERIELRRSFKRAVYADKGASVALDTCRVIDNGYSTSSGHFQGRGVYAKGAAGATFSAVNCAFEGNVIGSRTANSSDTGNGNDSGAALYLSTFDRATIDDTRFVTNGLANATNARSGRDWTLGYTVYATAAPLVARRSWFLGNGSLCHSADGGAVHLATGCGGSAFTNCAFVANFGHLWSSANSTRGGALVVNLANAADTLDVANCTFAYNLLTPSAGTHAGAGALHVVKGAAHVVDSIFTGQLVNSAYLAADVYCTTDATCAIVNSFFDDDTDKYFLGAGVTRTDCHYADPLLATDKTAMSAAFDGLGTITWPRCQNATIKPFKAGTDFTVFDAHLKSEAGRWNGSTWVQDAVQSPAIDAGNPAAAYANEPEPNGLRANCGAYGNTAEASKTPNGVPALPDPTVDQTHDYSQPHLSFTLGGTGEFFAEVTLYTGLSEGNQDGTGWDRAIPVAAAAVNGEAFDGIPFGSYFEKGETVHWLLVAKNAYGTSAKSGSLVIALDPPPWRGKGGGENVVHVRADATGSGDGSAWDTACTSLEAALALVTETRNEIWIAGDLVLPRTAVVAVPVAIRGGFDNFETNAAERVTTARSQLDGSGETPNELIGLVNVTAAGGQVVFDQLGFTRSKYRGLQVGSGADVTVRNCDFVANGLVGGTSWVTGMGLYAAGSGTSQKLEVSNCVFRANQYAGTNADTQDLSGFGAYLKSISASFTDCLFLTNGFKRSQYGGTANCAGRDNTKGAAIYANAAVVNALRCRFQANGGIAHNASDKDGGIVYLDGACGGSSFTNCAWVGNWHGKFNGEASTAGALVVKMANSADAVTLGNCTFAYNLTGGTNPLSAGINARKGAVTVADSIFFENLVASGSAKGDIYCAADATVNAVNCAFQSTGSYNVGTAAGYESNLTLTGPLTFDPLFATSKTTFRAAAQLGTMTECTSSSRPYFKNDDNAGFDVHLHSTVGRYAAGDWTTDEDNSPAVDAAQAGTAWALEPAPNGSRANLGAYGNTAEASKTTSAVPEILNAASRLEPNDYTQPYFTFTLGGSSAYAARVYLCHGAFESHHEGTEGWTYVRQLSANGAIGDEFDVPAGHYYNDGDTCYWRIVVETASASVAVDGTQAIAGEVPPWAGKGGGEHVLHVRQNASGAASGADWSNAYTDFATAFAAFLADGSKTEIWIAGTNVVTSAYHHELARPIVIRGGFTGSEDEPGERPAGAVSWLDGDTTSALVDIATAYAVTVERMGFMRAAGSGFVKSGAGDLSVYGCQFVSNGWSSANVQGRGLRASGTAGVTKLVVSNCLFLANCVYPLGQSSESFGVSAITGAGLYAGNHLAAEITGCEFDMNGLARGQNNHDMYAREACRGTALYLHNTPAQVKGCGFRGNRGVSHSTQPSSDGYWRAGGSPVFLFGSCGGSKFENCLFTGNEIQRWQDASGDRSAGMITAYLASSSDVCEFDHLTLAFNYVDTCTNATAGLKLDRGAFTLKNSILWDNLASTNRGATAALSVGENATLAVSYSLLASKTDSACVYEAVPGAITWGAGIVTKDPHFRTSRETFAAALHTAPKDVVNGGSWNYFADFAAVDAFDAHLVSRPRRSPAIDAGDPSSSYANEPLPNGARVNLGCYGNTAEAARSAVGTMLLLR